ncbi:MAG: fibronectin type III domain-containing protein, partial [Thermodesulfovibrionales bacterium]
VTSLAIDPITPSTLYAGTYGGGVFNSVGGAAWTDISTGLTNMNVTSLAIDPITPSTLYAGTYGGGVFNSVGGAAWTDMNEGLGNMNVNCLAIDNLTPPTLYAGTLGSVYDFQVPSAVYPDPMTWATEPYALTSTSISMVATVATATSDVSYFFGFVSSPTDGGTGGNDSSWQDSTSYTDSGLQPNHRYGYQVKARDSATTPNETSYSSPVVYKYTLANAPGTAAFSNITPSSIQAGWSANGNRSGTEYYCENTTKGTNSGWTTSTSMNSTGLNCDTQYSFRVKARNGDGIETGWTSLGSQSTTACPPTNNTLTVNKAGTGSGTVTSNPAGINCGGTCSASFSSFDPVQLVPTAAAGSTFAGWSGDIDCTDGIVTISTNLNCTATFNKAERLPVYRFWSGTSFFYTINEAEKNYVIATWPDVWHLEGIAYYAYTTQVPGTLPVYRFWDGRSFFYTINEAEKNYVIATWPDIWHLEGIAYYAFLTP